MATAASWLLDYSTLSGTHSAAEHFKNISTGDGTGGSASGEIVLNVGWQQVAIPVNRKLKDYFVDWLDAKINGYDSSKHAVDVMERASAYFGGENRFRTYVVGGTPEAAEGNFRLMMDDGDKKEVVGFWLKMYDYKDITNGDDLVFSWNSDDGE